MDPFSQPLNHDHLPKLFIILAYMQGIQLTHSTLAQICIQELATNFYQGRFSLLGLLQSFYCRQSLLAYAYRVSWLDATTRVLFIIWLPHAIHLTYHHHVFSVELSMSQTRKLRFHVFQSISRVMNIRPGITIVYWFKFTQRLIYSCFLLRWVNLVLFLIAAVITCILLS